VVTEQRSSVAKSIGLLLEKMYELHEEDQWKMQLIQDNAQVLH
jgi:hypothetical protein